MKKLIIFLLAFFTASIQAQSCCDRDKTPSSQTISSYGTPIGLAPTGSMGANGALTSGTALNATYSSGIWLHFPAGAVFSGSAAGFYWCVMSTTTAGTCYQNTYTPGTNSPDVPASLTAVSDAGPGAYTASTSEVALLYVNVGAGALGKNGSIRVVTDWINTNSANNKTLRVRYSGISGTAFFSLTATTQVTYRSYAQWGNRGVTNAQVGFAAGTQGIGSSSGLSATTASVDTTAATQVVITCQKATATDACVLDRSSTEILR